MKNDVVIPSKPIFSANIKLTIEVNPSKFLDSKLTSISGTYKFNIYRESAKVLSP